MNNEINSNITVEQWKEICHLLNKREEEFRRNNLFFIKVNIFIFFFILLNFFNSSIKNIDKIEKFFLDVIDLTAKVKMQEIIQYELLDSFEIIIVLGFFATTYCIIRNKFILYDIEDTYKIIIKIETLLPFKPFKDLREMEQLRKYNYKRKFNYDWCWYSIGFYFLCYIIYFKMLTMFFVFTLLVVAITIFLVWFFKKLISKKKLSKIQK